MSKLKSLLPGILIGIALAVVGMMVWDKIQETRVEKGVAYFLSGLEQAEDKDAYINNYDFDGDGLNIGISTSSADESGDCYRIEKAIEELKRMLEYAEWYANVSYPTGTSDRRHKDGVWSIEHNIKGMEQKLRSCSEEPEYN